MRVRRRTQPDTFRRRIDIARSRWTGISRAGTGRLPMTILDNLSIRTKVIGAFALVLMVNALVGIFALDGLASVDAGANDVTDNWLAGTQSLGAFATATMRFRQVEGSI